VWVLIRCLTVPLAGSSHAAAVGGSPMFRPYSALNPTQAPGGGMGGPVGAGGRETRAREEGGLGTGEEEDEPWDWDLEGKVVAKRTKPHISTTPM
jgi:hypothetical protein